MSLRDDVKGMHSDIGATMLVHKMDEQLVKNSVEKQIDRVNVRGRFHVSSFLSDEFCAREIYYTITESAEESTANLPARTLRIFLQGEIMHQKYQNLFKQMGIALFIEKSRYSALYDLTGTPDAIIMLMNRPYIIEIKSVNTTMFNTLKKPPVNAVKQASMYMMLTGIPNAIVLAEDKNNQNIKAFSIKFDPNIVAPIIKRLKFAKKAVDNTLIPTRYCKSINDRRASHCPFRDLCFMRHANKPGYSEEKVLAYES